MINRHAFFTLSALSTVLLMSGQHTLAADNVTGTLVRTIEASAFNPPSPDTSGLTYLSFSNTLLLSDGEVNEMPVYFTGDNLFEMTLLGELIATASTTNLSQSGYTNEPNGLAANPNNGHLFVSSDDDKSIYEINPGPDGQLFTADDIHTSFSTSAFGSNDPEGIAYDAVEGALYIADGLNSEVYKILPGPDGRFDTPLDNQVSSFDTESLGVHDPEGIELIAPGELYLVGKPATRMAHLYTAGPLLRYVDISQANADKPAGIAVAPGSSEPSVLNAYIADRGVDNDKDPNENDGKVYEISVPPVPAGNRAPGVAAGPDLTIVLPAGATLDGAVVDDGPGTVTSTWSKVSGPGTVTFGDAGAVDTMASFNAIGRYVLRLTASDGQLTASDEVEVQARQPFSAPFTTIYVSTTSSDKIGNLTFADEDIIAYDTASETWSMYFDGSAVGLGLSGMDINAFEIMNDGSILLSFDDPATVTINGVPTLVEPSDIVRFIPTSLGNNTAGVFEWFFDGSDVGLDTIDENIDAISFLPDGRLVISVTARYTVPGLKGLDEDLIAFSASDLGEETSGTWSMHFDGSKVGMSDGGDGEDINGVWLDSNNGDNSNIYLTTKGSFLVNVASGGADDIFRCIPSSTGTAIACDYDFTWDGINNGLPPGTVVDGIALSRELSGGIADTIPPTVSLTAPVSGDTVAGTVTLTADAADNIGVAGVQFRVDGNPLGAEDTSPPYTTSWDATTVPDGQHSLTAVARDAAGNMTESNTVLVMVENNPPPADTTPPTVSLTAPGDGATVSGTVSLTADAADDVGVAGVQFQLDGNPLEAEVTTAPYAISWDTTTAAAGTHTLTAVARDAAGNTTVSSAVSVTVSNPPATLTFTPTADAAIKADLPNKNYGASVNLGARNSPSPVEDFLMKLTVSGVGSRSIVSARLRLYNVDSSDKGGDFYAIADTSWTESGVTWSNAPAAGSLVASLGAVTKDTWYEVDVTSLITGDGVFGLRVKSTSSNWVGYGSKERAGVIPELVVTVE
jgi:Bacterial Ig domain/K319L-like, PKD domain